MRLGIVIPSYNEEENVEELVKEILVALKSYDFELAFVNDGSKDKTGELVDRLARTHEKIEAIHHETNKGYAEALKTGFNNGISKGMDAILIMDSDLTHDPKDIPKFIKSFNEGADIVVGSRYVPGGGMTNVPPRRVFISKTANFMFRVILGLKVKDVSSGFRGYKREVLENIRIQSDSFQIHVELTTKAARSGYIIKEVPIMLENRRMGTSSFNLSKVAMKYVKLVIRLRLKRNT
ncbi:MAG: glycosyltransferase [Thermoplasmata archaeon]|nr:MAG: glycosyltransferase [Thermoplasmata archaeon]